MPLRNLWLAVLLFLASALALASPVEEEPPLLTRTLPGKTLDEAVADLRRAIENNNYSFVRQQAVDSRLVPQDWEVRSVLVVYFCSFAKMDRTLRMDTRAAALMPCRVTMIETGSGVELIAVNPVWQTQSWENPPLHNECRTLKADYLAIFEEASL